MRELTEEQTRAVARREGSLLLAAGAGSGKTSVLVERFVAAVLEDGVAPGKILAITFTERAAGELRERVRMRFLELGEREAARDTEAALVSTFHGFCARLLRIHPLLAELDPEFTILDEGLAGRLRLQAFRAALRDFLARGGGAAVELVAAYTADRLRGMLLGVYAEQRSRGQNMPQLPLPRPRGATGPARAELLVCLQQLEPELEAAQRARPGKRLEQALATLGRARECLGGDGGPQPPGRLTTLKLAGAAAGALASPACDAYRAALMRYTEVCADHYGAQTCVLLNGLLEGFTEHYAALKQARGALDFDDLELRARTLLENQEDVRTSWSERLDLLMVDEFQDTNRRQLGLLALLERGNLFTVGDELQSIYSFRHADVEIFRGRQSDLTNQGASLVLARNFRSRPPLIAAVNEVFGARFGVRYTPLEVGREALESGENGQGEPAVELLLTDRLGWEGETWREAEARQLAERVSELVGGGLVRAGEVAVLLRALGDLPVYERALERCGLSTLASVGSFWSDQQVGDLLAYLRVLASPLDELALYSTLASPLVGLSSDGLVQIARVARSAGVDVWSTMTDADSRLWSRLSAVEGEALRVFVARLRAERGVAPTYGVAELLGRVLTTSGYQEWVLRQSRPERRLANIHKLLRLARRFERQEGRDLRGFLDHVAHQVDYLEGSEPQAPVADGSLEAVRLMSIHAAKGLEFGVVCVADLGRAGNLGLPDLLVDEHRVGLRLVGLDGHESLPALEYERLAATRRAAEAEEEERIIYVAMTRARERLLLSGAVDFGRWPEVRLGAPPIAWLGPALLPDLGQRLAGSQPPPGALELTQSGVALRCQLNVPVELDQQVLT